MTIKRRESWLDLHGMRLRAQRVDGLSKGIVSTTCNKTHKGRMRYDCGMFLERGSEKGEKRDKSLTLDRI